MNPLLWQGMSDIGSLSRWSGNFTRILLCKFEGQIMETTSGTIMRNTAIISSPNPLEQNIHINEEMVHEIKIA